MMPIRFKLVLLTLSLLIVSSCRDEPCETFDWIGEYHRVSQECDTVGPGFEDIIIISDGFGENTLMMNNGFFEVTNCEGEIPNLATLELNGDELIARGLGCTAFYTRQ